MMIKYLLLALLPAVAYSRINIKIKAGRNEAVSDVIFSGSDEAEISDKERNTFKLDDETLKRASEKINGKRCDDVYLKPPTPWGDVFREYGWKVSKRTITPVRGTIRGINSSPVAVASAEYVNSHHSISATYSTSVTQQVEETVEHTWSSGGELSVGQEINYGVNFGAASVGGATSLSYSSTWGEDKTEGRTVTIGTTSGVAVTIPPGETVIATLVATQGTMDVVVSYEGSLSNGFMLCNYANKYKGHHFTAIPIRDIQRIERLPSYVRYNEQISIGFYTRARIEVTNGSSHEEMNRQRGGFVGVGQQQEW